MPPMPEPLFDQIARQLTDQANAITPITKGMIYYDIKDALRQVWHARGAADLQIVDLFVPRGTVEIVTERIQALNAVDPHAADPGTPTTRV